MRLSDMTIMWVKDVACSVAHGYGSGRFMQDVAVLLGADTDSAHRELTEVLALETRLANVSTFFDTL